MICGYDYEIASGLRVLLLWWTCTRNSLLLCLTTLISISNYQFSRVETSLSIERKVTYRKNLQFLIDIGFVAVVLCRGDCYKYHQQPDIKHLSASKRQLLSLYSFCGSSCSEWKGLLYDSNEGRWRVGFGNCGCRGRYT